MTKLSLSIIDSQGRQSMDGRLLLPRTNAYEIGIRSANIYKAKGLLDDLNTLSALFASMPVPFVQYAPPS